MHLFVEGVSLTLSGKTILDDVTFEVKDGEFVSVLGESGAGKSTTLKIVAGLMAQDKGRILFDGECVDNVPTHKRSTAIVFQDIRLFPNMSVVENVAFPLKMQGVQKAARIEEARKMLDAVQLLDHANKRVTELSGGQQQRVALARALAGKPRMVLLDEPFSGLDESLRADMRKLVLLLHQQFYMTCLMVTHDPDEALCMSDRIVYVSNGKLLQDGTPTELLLNPAAPEVAACFGKTSAIEGTVQSGVFHSGKLTVEAPEVVNGPAVLVRVTGGKPFVHSIG